METLKAVMKQSPMRSNSLRFNLQEIGGALGDLGTLLPLIVGLVLVNGLNATSVLVAVGVFYIISGLYFRIPMPVQPLKAVSAIAISLGLSTSVISASGLLMGLILLLLSTTNLISVVARLFPRAVVRGIQLSIGLMLFRKAIELFFGGKVFASGASSALGVSQFTVGMLLGIAALATFIIFQFVFVRQTRGFPPMLALLGLGLGAGLVSSPFPGIGNLAPALPAVTLPTPHDFWVALTILVLPQLPLTLGNAVVGTRDTARTYFNDQACRVTPRALTASMGLANVAAGLFGAMPMCHGSGGLTAHYKMGARTGGANLMIGGLLLALGLLFGRNALPVLSLVPLSVLGVLLAIVGVYHALLIRDLTAIRHLAVAGVVAMVAITFDNLAFGFSAGILLHHLLKMLPVNPTLDGLNKVDRN